MNLPARTGAVIALQLAFVALVPAAFAQVLDCSRPPRVNFTELKEAEAKSYFLRYWTLRLCQLKTAKDDSVLHKYTGHDELLANLSETFNANIKRVRDRERFPHAAYIKKAFGEYFPGPIQLDLINYFSVARSIGSLERDPNRRGRDLYAGSVGFAHRGGNPKANAERVARDVQLKPLPPWFVIGKIDIRDSEIERRFRDAERRYLDAKHKVEFERVDLAQAETSLEKETRAQIDFDRTERARVLAEAQRLSQQKGRPVVGPNGEFDGDYELVVHDSARRKQVARDRLARFQVPYDRAKAKVDAAERERDASLDEMMKVRPLLKIKIVGIKSADYAAEWQAVEARERAIEELARARETLKQSVGELGDIQKFRDNAFAELKEAYASLDAAGEKAAERGLYSLGLQAVALGVQRYLEIAQGGGGVSTLIRTVIQAGSDVADRPKIVDPYSFDWSALNSKNLQAAQQEIRDGNATRLAKDFIKERGEDLLKAAPEQGGKAVADKAEIERLKDFHPNKRARQLEELERLKDLKRLTEAKDLQKLSELQKLKELQKKVASYEGKNGFKSLSKQFSLDALKDLGLSAATDVVKAAVAKFLEGPAVQDYVAAYARSGTYAKIYHDAAVAYEKQLQSIALQEVAIGEALARLKSNPNVNFKVTRNDPFFAENRYGFDLVFPQEAGGATARANIDVALVPEQGAGAASAAQAEIALRPVVDVGKITYVLSEQTAEQLSQSDVEKLSLVIRIAPPR